VYDVEKSFAQLTRVEISSKVMATKKTAPKAAPKTKKSIVMKDLDLKKAKKDPKGGLKITVGR
jgi:hypothetical protein